MANLLGQHLDLGVMELVAGFHRLDICNELLRRPMLNKRFVDQIALFDRFPGGRVEDFLLDARVHFEGGTNLQSNGVLVGGAGMTSRKKMETITVEYSSCTKAVAPVEHNEKPTARTLQGTASQQIRDGMPRPVTLTLKDVLP